MSVALLGRIATAVGELVAVVWRDGDVGVVAGDVVVIGIDVVAMVAVSAARVA